MAPGVGLGRVPACASIAGGGGASKAVPSRREGAPRVTTAGWTTAGGPPQAPLPATAPRLCSHNSSQRRIEDDAGVRSSLGRRWESTDNQRRRGRMTAPSVSVRATFPSTVFARFPAAAASGGCVTALAHARRRAHGGFALGASARGAWNGGYTGTREEGHGHDDAAVASDARSDAPASTPPTSRPSSPRPAGCGGTSEMTTHAGSGHPSSSMSAIDVIVGSARGGIYGQIPRSHTILTATGSSSPRDTPRLPSTPSLPSEATAMIS